MDNEINEVSLYERVEKDYQEVVNKLIKKGVKTILLNSYKLSFMQEVLFYFEQLDKDNSNYDELIKLYDYKGNIPEEIYDDYTDYNSPENFNFHTYDGISEIIMNFVYEIKKEQK